VVYFYFLDTLDLAIQAGHCIVSETKKPKKNLDESMRV